MVNKCIKLQFIHTVNGDMQKVTHLKQQKIMTSDII